MGEEALNLSTIAERETVNVTSKMHRGGKVYEVLGGHELSLWEVARLEAFVAELGEMRLDKEPTPAQKRAQRKALTGIVSIVAPTIETRVVGEMSDLHLLAVFGLFNQAEDGGGSGNAGSAQTSGASSRGSKGSTAASRKRGSTSRSGS